MANSLQPMDCRVCAKLEGGPSPTADAHVLSKYLSANSGETAANPAQIRTAGHGRRGPWTHKAPQIDTPERAPIYGSCSYGAEGEHSGRRSAGGQQRPPWGAGVQEET